MIIQLKKFGTTLTSRQLGKEAYLAFNNTLATVNKDEEIVIDFDGVNTLSPSWADEFITPLAKERPDKITIKKTDNLSVDETIKLLKSIHGYNIN